MKKVGYIAVTLLAGLTLAHGQYHPPLGGGGDFGFSWTPKQADFVNSIGFFINGPSNITTLSFADATCGYIGIENSTNLQGFSASKLEFCLQGTILFSDNGSLKTISVPKLKSVDQLTFTQDQITSLDLPQLTNCSDIKVNESLITNLDLTRLISGAILLGGCPLLQSITLPALVNENHSMSIQDNLILTSLTFPSYVPLDGDSLTLNGNHFTATCVNQILAQLVASGAQSGFLDLSGGFNAAPTGQGITDVATLQAAGWNVITN